MLVIQADQVRHGTVDLTESAGANSSRARLVLPRRDGTTDKVDRLVLAAHGTMLGIMHAYNVVIVVISGRGMITEKGAREPFKIAAGAVVHVPAGDVIDLEALEDLVVVRVFTPSIAATFPDND